jgi:hypothetical protein
MLPSMAETQMLVYGHAPYIALLFKPFAMLPYIWAYVAWLAFSASLYITGLAVLFRATGIAPGQRTTGLLLGAGFMPFLFETWIGGQLSVVIFFIWALFFYLRRQNRLFLAGAALALVIFKPTLAALPVAMLIVGRRWRIFGGFVTGAAAMAALSIGLVGWEGCRGWVDTLRFNSKFIAGPGEAWHLAKSVDMNSFFHLLLFNARPLTEIVAAGFGMLALGALGMAWWRLPAAENWLWAATLCLTLVVNSYAPIYDTLLVVVAAALAAGSMEGCTVEDREGFRAWLLLLYLGAWLTQSMAEFLHLQLLTLVLTGFAAWGLQMAYRAALSTKAYLPIGVLDRDAIRMSSKKVLLPQK